MALQLDLSEKQRIERESLLAERLKEQKRLVTEGNKNTSNNTKNLLAGFHKYPPGSIIILLTGKKLKISSMRNNMRSGRN